MTTKAPTFFAKSGGFHLTKRAICDIICEKYGKVLEWGHLRALSVADAASNKEWQRSKFLSEQRFEILGTATGRRGVASTQIPFRASFKKLNRFTEKYSSGRRGVTRNFSVILELPFQNPLFYKGFARCEYNFICLFSPTVLSDFREQME